MVILLQTILAKSPDHQHPGRSHRKINVIYISLTKQPKDRHIYKLHIQNNSNYNINNPNLELIKIVNFKLISTYCRKNTVFSNKCGHYNNNY